jgi:hypothetical protein
MAVAGTDHQTTASRTLATAVLTPRVRRALENQKVTAFSDLARALPDVLMETDLHLGRQREQSSLPKLQMVAFESMRLLRTAEAGLIAWFLQELEVGLADLNASRGSRRLEDVVAPTEGLTLVDDSETNEGSMLANVALRADSRNSLALQLMGYRYGVLAGAPAFDAEHLPLGPHALCHALRNAAHAAGLPADVRLLLYGQFEKVVMPHYPVLLDTLNARLADDGILPHLSFVPVRVRASTEPGSEGPTSADNQSPAQHSGSPTTRACHKWSRKVALVLPMTVQRRAAPSLGSMHSVCCRYCWRGGGYCSRNCARVATTNVFANRSRATRCWIHCAGCATVTRSPATCWRSARPCWHKRARCTGMVSR